MLALYLTYIDDEPDKKKFEELYYAYRKQMTVVALSILHNQSDAEDVVHDVFLNIAIKHMKIIDRIENDIDLRNYLLKATKNTALNWYKRRKSMVYMGNEDEVVYDVKNIKDDAFVEYICQKTEYDRVFQAVQKLEPKYRDVIYYHFVLEIPVPQVAKMLNQTLSATKKQLVRGKKKLLYLLEEEK